MLVERHTIETHAQSSQSQGYNLENRDILKIPSRTNVNATKDILFYNIKIKREDTEQCDGKNVVN